MEAYKKVREHLENTNQVPAILADGMRPKYTCVIMMGLPGSGKDTLARALFGHLGILHSGADKHLRTLGLADDAALCSVDSYFYSLGNGEYAFEPSKLSDAHKACFAKAKRAFELDIPLVVVNNTNMTRWERSPYIMLAEHYEYTPVVVRVEVPLHTALERGVHGVPEDVVRSMYSKMEHPQLRHRSVTFDNGTALEPKLLL